MKSNLPEKPAKIEAAIAVNKREMIKFCNFSICLAKMFLKMSEDPKIIAKYKKYIKALEGSLKYVSNAPHLQDSNLHIKEEVSENKRFNIESQ